MKKLLIGTVIVVLVLALELSIGVHFMSKAEENPETPIQNSETTTVAIEETDGSETPIQNRTYFEVPLARGLQDYIFDQCEIYNIDPALVIALIHVESCFISTAESKTNDFGLMQINSFNNEWLKETLGVTDMLDPYQNVQAGIYILNNCRRSVERNFPDVTGEQKLHMILMSYNMGFTGANRNCWSNNVYSSRYSEKIMSYYESYK